MAVKWSPIMPRDGSLSYSIYEFFQHGQDNDRVDRFFAHVKQPIMLEIFVLSSVRKADIVLNQGTNIGDSPAHLVDIDVDSSNKAVIEFLKDIIKVWQNLTIPSERVSEIIITSDRS